VSAGRMIHARTLLAIYITSINNMMIAFGALMLIVGLYFVAFKASVVAGAFQVVGLVLAAGAMFLIIGAVGHGGMFKRKLLTIRVYMALQVLLAGLSAAACAVCFNSTTNVADYVAKLDDKALGEMSSALGFAMTASQVVAKVQANLHQLGLAFAMVLILQVSLFVATVLLIWAFKAAHLLGNDGHGNAAGHGGGHTGPIVLGDKNKAYSHAAAPRAGKASGAAARV
jgi:hypothetical protein